MNDKWVGPPAGKGSLCHWISATPGQPSPPVSSMGVVNFSLLRHRLQTKKPESSPSTRARLRAPPKMGHSRGKEVGGDAAQPRQKSLCGRAGQDAQSMHLSRSALQELPREQGVVPGEGAAGQRLGRGTAILGAEVRVGRLK